MNYTNFEKHLEKIYKDVYNEPRSPQHTNSARETLEEFCKDLDIRRAVEFGCGMAPSLDLLKEWGVETLGVTMGTEIPDHPVLREDMHFTSLENQSYDLVIARHVLEHSPMPLILLMEMRRVARKYAIVILPYPDEWAIRHRNHYSVFKSANWEWLFELSGWKVLNFKKSNYYNEPEHPYFEYRYLLEAI